MQFQSETTIFKFRRRIGGFHTTSLKFKVQIILTLLQFHFHDIEEQLRLLTVEFLSFCVKRPYMRTEKAITLVKKVTYFGFRGFSLPEQFMY